MTKKVSEYKKSKPSVNIEKLRKESPFLKLFEGIPSNRNKIGKTFIKISCEFKNSKRFI
tara:strand:- start:422 stop:598 length:177 start_codon:yes stop_codon:yes gene_type:complete